MKLYPLLMLLYHGRWIQEADEIFFKVLSILKNTTSSSRYFPGYLEIIF